MERINGYLREKVPKESGSIESKENENQSAEEYLASQGISIDEIKKIIIEAE